MPTYEYVCKSCGHLFEIVQSMRDEPLRECPECGGELRKVFAPPAISFKGSGFYATDHGKKSSKQPGEKGDKGETAGKAGTGTEKGDASAPKERSTSAVPSGSSGPSPGASGSSGSSKEGSSS
jgi:putative FmdB family regulatory protein